MKRKFKQARRVENLPPYLFAELDKKKLAAQERGMDIISFGIGDPDQPTPQHIIDELNLASSRPANHQYPSYEGMPAFREAAAAWYRERFKIDLDPKSEVVSLIGSKEGIAHMPLVYVEPGDTVLVPNPGYPVYSIGTLFAGGESHYMPLLSENNFLPDYSAIPAEVADKAKLLWINYPNNPTGATAPREFYEETVAFAVKHDLLVCHDAAYTEIYFGGEKPSSFLEVPGAREVGVEFHSLSKTFNMTGWRIGFACGNAEVIEGLGRIKTNIDSGIFQAVQEAGIVALQGPATCVDEINGLYRDRRDVLVAGLRELGWNPPTPTATFYLWIPCPDGYDSTTTASRLLDEVGVMVTPGVGFGKYGEGYIRMTITVDENRIKEALARIEKVKW